MPKSDELQFERVIASNIFRLFPLELFEQLKDTDVVLDNLLLFGQGVVLNPLTYLYALTDLKHRMEGILWARVDCVDALFEVYYLSVTKEYQDGGILGRVLDFMREVRDTERPKLEKILTIKLKDKMRFCTSRTAALKKVGARASKRQIMEFDYDEGIPTDNGESVSKKADA